MPIMYFLLPKVAFEYIIGIYMNYDDLLSELLVRIRGKRSQRRLSTLLGYSGNQVFRWESRLRKISWVDFVRFCEVCNVPMDQYLKQVFGPHINASEPWDLFKHLAAKRDSALIAKGLQSSKPIVGRWLRGETEIPAITVLQAMDIFANQLPDLLARITSLEFLSSLEPRHFAHRRMMTEFSECPELISILGLLCTNSYLMTKEAAIPHLSKRLGLSEEVISDFLSRLFALDLFEEVNGKLRLKNPERLLNLGGDKVVNNKIVGHWMNKTLRFIAGNSHKSKNSRFGYNLILVNENLIGKLFEAISEFMQKLDEIEAQSLTSPDRGMVVTFSVLDLDEVPIEIN
jgi:hypothetical protein